MDEVIESSRIGNISIVGDVRRGNFLVYRHKGIGLENDLVCVFPQSEQGLICATLFGAYMAEMFPDGDITQGAVDAKFGDDDGSVKSAELKRDRKAEKRALEEINRLNLFGTEVGIEH